jgi:hypothetical protein
MWVNIWHGLPYLELISLRSSRYAEEYWNDGIMESEDLGIEGLED